MDGQSSIIESMFTHIEQVLYIHVTFKNIHINAVMADNETIQYESKAL